MQYSIGPPPMNPLSRLLAGILAVLALAGAFFFGVLVLALAFGVGIVAWFLLWVRIWWMRKKHPGSAENKGETLEAEYTVVSRKDDD